MPITRAQKKRRQQVKKAKAVGRLALLVHRPPAVEETVYGDFTLPWKVVGSFATRSPSFYMDRVTRSKAHLEPWKLQEPRFIEDDVDDLVGCDGVVPGLGFWEPRQAAYDVRKKTEFARNMQEQANATLRSEFVSAVEAVQHAGQRQVRKHSKVKKPNRGRSERR